MVIEDQDAADARSEEGADHAGSTRQSRNIDASKSSASSSDIRRQAVLVIHGMGEQRPMETLRSFVREVWEKDTRLTRKFQQRGKDADQCEKGRISKPCFELAPNLWLNHLWIVPDGRTGSAELSRITTPPDDRGIRTDFYELYWADIMQGTSWDHLKSWVRGLLLRWPYQVPTNVVSAWVALWVLTVVASLFFFVGMIQAVAEMTGNTHNSIARFVSHIPTPFNWDGKGDPSPLGSHLFAAIAGVMAAIGAVSISRSKLRARKNAFDAKEVDPTWLPDRRDRRAVLLWAGFVGFVVYLTLWAVTALGAWSMIIGAGIGLVLQVVVVPYLGDVARYVLVTGANIQKRAAIHERGLGLLRALHRIEPPEDGEKVRKGATPPPAYERIVVVGHSLGSIIAYDLLRLFWLEAGLQRKNNQTNEVAKAIDKVVEAATFAELERESRPKSKTPAPQGSDGMDQRDPWRDEHLMAYQNAQYGVFEALSAKARLDEEERRRTQDDDKPAPMVWRISDFVTLGSPLTHCEFLLAKDHLELAQKVLDRQLPISPPLPTVVEDMSNARTNRPDRQRSAEFRLVVEESGEVRNPTQADFADAKEKDGSVIRKDVKIQSAQTETPATNGDTGQPKVVMSRFNDPSTTLDLRPQHASMFAATRWTNIYDQPSRIVLGDFVSGPVGGLSAERLIKVREQGETKIERERGRHEPGFGFGIRDMKVTIRRPTGPAWIRRFFTHTLYWDGAVTANWDGWKRYGKPVFACLQEERPDRGEADETVDSALRDEPWHRQHIAALRFAIDLGQEKTAWHAEKIAAASSETKP
ncbi:hypothetical protein [Fulvimarina sp. MAC8]|uniref:hypothetical protein n=1 Tax=Fulvimarina sp. MAC8 TaxID=3162874 RepID=UPI0032EEC443